MELFPMIALVLLLELYIKAWVAVEQPTSPTLSLSLNIYLGVILLQVYFTSIIVPCGGPTATSVDWALATRLNLLTSRIHKAPVFAALNAQEKCLANVA